LLLQAEIAQYAPEEYQQYEESLKHYRDLKNTVDTAFGEGKVEGKIEVARNLINSGVSVEIISQSTGLSIDEINGIK